MRAARTKPDGRLRTSLAALSRLGDLPAVAMLAWAGWLAMPWSFGALAQAHTATETTGGQGTALPPSTHEVARVHALPSTHEFTRVRALPSADEVTRVHALPSADEVARVATVPGAAFPVVQHPPAGSAGSGTAVPGGTSSALSAERAKLAAEVHDAAGHGFAAIAMQANIALRLLEQNPEQARASLEAIRDTSTEALTRLRGALDAMDPASGARPPAADHATHALPGTHPVRGAQVTPVSPVPGSPITSSPITGSPVPGDAVLGDPVPGDPVPRDPMLEDPVPGADLTRLIAGVRAAGLVVAVAPGDPVPAHLAAPVYGVVRESLTNVLRHAGTAGVCVKLASTPGEFVVEVADQGRALLPAPEGRGLAGMRAQVAAAGGVFAAGPRQGGGFQVVARFPATPATTSVPATTGTPATAVSPAITA
ncbi:sensor histidine kinase [Nonomuraea soli]|uniref:histidine kinase n=1 Tax=Nonomuraea soli TaxID=1032476 RepID=A0A7W0HN07_9ACTN|nr:histidine kinase [Nonomuraea soli]MBA2889283.1 signal transduction histidine kinase [Nonomuraea soli]